MECERFRESSNKTFVKRDIKAIGVGWLGLKITKLSMVDFEVVS